MSVRPIIQTFKDNPDYDENMFINSDEARDIVDDNTVVVVVDTNKPSYTECEDLLHMSKTIVVLDHHRQGSEVIQNAVLSYSNCAHPKKKLPDFLETKLISF